jgi:hypothetical protein
MKCRRQLRVTGVSSAAYWFSRLVSDGVQFYITAVLFVMLLLAFQVCRDYACVKLERYFGDLNKID